MSKTTNSYHNFAYYYSQLIDESFYQDYLAFLQPYAPFNNIIDLACGSGTLCFLLKNEFNEVVGLDMSEEMLMIAQNKNYEKKKGVKFLQQDLRTLILLEDEYDLITCTLDSLNYIENIDDINNIFKQVSKALKSNSLFAFDLLTQFYLDEIVADYYQCEEVNDFEYVWQTNKIADTVLKHDLKIVSDREQYEEVHYQYIHDFNKVENMLKENNLKIIETKEASNELNTRDSSRRYYLVKKENE